MHEKIKQLRETRAKLITDAKALLSKPGVIGKEDEQKFDAMMAEADQCTAEIERMERVIKAEQELDQRVMQRAGREGISLTDRKLRDEHQAEIFHRWMLVGMEGLNAEERQFMQTRHMPLIQAAQSTTGSAGGFMIPQAFSDRLEIALKFYSGMLQNADVIETESGAAMPWPTVNDTAQKGAILAENATIPAQDVTFASVTLDAYMYTSKLIAVSWQLMQDAAFSVENLIADIAGERLGRIWNEHFTTGTGSSQPNGVVTASTQGKVGTTGQTGSVIYDDLIDLIYSVDKAYRQQAKFMMNDASVKIIRKLKDANNLPLWQPSVQAGEPDSILGYPLVVNNDVATMAANAKSILFGDLKKYKIRRVRGMGLLRLNERYADALQVGFFAFGRADGDLIDAGTNPVKHYANSAT